MGARRGPAGNDADGGCRTKVPASAARALSADLGADAVAGLEAAPGEATTPTFSFLNLPTRGSRDERGGAAGGSRARGGLQAFDRTSFSVATDAQEVGRIAAEKPGGVGAGGMKVGARAIPSPLRYFRLTGGGRSLGRRPGSRRRWLPDWETEVGRPLRPTDGSRGPQDELEEDAKSLPDLVAAAAELA
jgi:hypothetical protein